MPKTNTTTQRQVGKAAETLSMDNLEDLLELLKVDLRAKCRMQLFEDIKQSRREYQVGRSRIVTPEEIIKAALS